MKDLSRVHHHKSYVSVGTCSAQGYLVLITGILAPTFQDLNFTSQGNPASNFY